MRLQRSAGSRAAHLRLVTAAESETISARVPTTQSEQLEDLLAGLPVHLTQVDLVALANLPYRPLDPEQDPAALSAATVALDALHYRVGSERAVGGTRAKALHDAYTRYLLPFLLEHRAAGLTPLTFGALVPGDNVSFRDVLRGEQPLPAAAVAADRLKGRLALTCVWLTVAEAAQVCESGEHQVREQVALHRDASGQELVRAVDLRSAGLLDSDDPLRHGLAQGSAGNVLTLLHALWDWASLLGVALPGNPRAIKALRPLTTRRQRVPKSETRAAVPLARCFQVAAELHVVHQLVLWLLRLVALRDSEVFGLLVRDWEPGYLHVRAVGGKPRLARDVDGQIVPTERRSGTKGSREGEVPLDGPDVEAEGILERRLRIPTLVDRLVQDVIAVFHTDPVTGRVDPDARLVPGIQDDDARGITSFTTELKRACEQTHEGEGPVRFTPHDCRAQLNTDLTNAGVEGRLHRYYLGHRSGDGGRALDVNAKHYDLGPDDEQLRRVAEAVDGLLPGQLTTLRVRTTRMPQWGTGTRMHERRGHIESSLRVLQWYASRGTGEEPDLSLAEAAQRLSLSPSQLKRLLYAGALQGRQAPWGKRQVWVVPVREVERELLRRQEVALPDLAVRLGLDRHSLWTLVTELGLLPQERSPGEHIRLSAEQVQQVERALRRRAQAAAAVMPLASAGALLGLPETAVQTLVRRGELEVADSDGRAMCVTTASVQAFDAAHPRPETVQPDEPVLSVADAAVVLNENRHTLGHLLRGRQLASATRDRRQVIGVRSLQALLARSPRPGAEQRLATVLAMRS